MQMKMRILGSVGAILVTMSATGAVAYAATTTTHAGYRPYAAQIKTELQQIKSLREQVQQLNQQLKTDFQGLKGQHLKKTDPTDYQAFVALHQQILGARAKLDTDNATVLLDRQSKDWAKMVTDLQTKDTDWQSLISLKQQQLKNVQHASTTASGSSNSSSNG